VPDFSSALYLGLRHRSAELQAWASLTTGRPAALQAPPGAGRVAAALAALQGCEAGTLAPSTLHVFWDLFTILTRPGSTVYVDGGSYPIARWGVERARNPQVPVRVFPHHDAPTLHRLLGPGSGRPIVVADGFCPSCGRPAPIARYLEAVRRAGGILVLDDTQALGILGERRGPSPYGRGGGGSLRWAGVRASEILVVSSLAKGFGAPVAALCGTVEQVRRFEAQSQTRIHCSPPSAAVIRAAEHALAVNRRDGDLRRLRLARLVQRFRAGLGRAGIETSGGVFPVQTLHTIQGREALLLHDRLAARGVHPVLHRARRTAPACVSFLITAAHSEDQVDGAARAVTEVSATLRHEASPWDSHIRTVAGV
jgi:8-amino-7-oxononanoate synthase